MSERLHTERLHVITAVTRLDNLPVLRESLAGLARSLRAGDGDPTGLPSLDLWWWVVLDSAPRPLPAPVAALLRDDGAGAPPVVPLFHPGPARDAAGQPAFGHAQRSAALDHIEGGWVWTLDDDNLCHPRFGPRLRALIRDHPGAGAFVVGLDMADGRRLHAVPSEVAPTRVDTAQYVLRRDVIGDERLRPVHGDDGGFVQRVFARHPDRFVFCDEVLAWHNRLAVPRAWPHGEC